MAAWFKIALRNLIKNRRRSLVTTLAIALGFAAVNLFGGFTRYMYSGNREMAIFGQTQGHLTIFKKGFLEEGKLNPSHYLLTPAEMKAIQEICRKNPHIKLVTPQLMITGLVTNGKVSTIFVGHGIVPQAANVFAMNSRLMKAVLMEDRRLSEDNKEGVVMARGLAQLLDVAAGSYVVAFTNTFEGYMNALDMMVLKLFDTDSAIMNDKVVRVPFSFAQELYDTDRADRLAVLLDRSEYTQSVRDQLQASFARRGLAVEVKTWEELSEWYRKVKAMFDVIFLFLFTIVFVIVVMSVINTMGMAVIERTREIGTLRALGLKCKGVVLLFAIESGLLGIFGTLGGFFLTFCGWWIVNVFEPTWIPPGITRRVPIRIEYVPDFMLFSFLALFFLCLIASLIPARRAAKQNVVEALGHV